MNNQEEDHKVRIAMSQNGVTHSATLREYEIISEALKSSTLLLGFFYSKWAIESAVIELAKQLEATRNGK